MRDLWGMQRDLDRLMSAFTTVSSPSSTGLSTTAMAVPTMDVVKSGDDLVLRAEMPGIKPADIDISIVERMLTLKGTRHEETETKDEDYVVRESTYGSFERSVRLPEGYDAKTIRAEYRDGVLEVIVPGGATPMEASAIHVPIATPTPEKLEGHH